MSINRLSSSNITYFFRILKLGLFVGALVFARFYIPLKEFIDNLETANRILFFASFILFIYVVTYIFEKFTRKFIKSDKL